MLHTCVQVTWLIVDNDESGAVTVTLTITVLPFYCSSRSITAILAVVGWLSEFLRHKVQKGYAAPDKNFKRE